jgi:hypothetical protein
VDYFNLNGIKSLIFLFSIQMDITLIFVVQHIILVSRKLSSSLVDGIDINPVAQPITKNKAIPVITIDGCLDPSLLHDSISKLSRRDKLG